MSVTDDFRTAIEQAGLNPPPVIPLGKLIRFPGVGKSNGDTSGWAKLFEDEEGGVYGDWSTGLSETWQAKRATPMTKGERVINRRRVAELQRLRAEEETRMNAAAAAYAQKLCEEADPAPADHPYLQRKKIQAHGLQVDEQNRLIVPVMIDGQIASVQFIPTEEGRTKLFLRDGVTKSGCFILGELSEAKTILISEGFATAASLYEATGYPTVIAFSAGNLRPVAEQLRQQFPTATVLLCADNDVRTDGTINTGVEAATAAAKAINGLLAVPGAINNSQTDWNDVHVARGLDAVREAIRAAVIERASILDEVYAFLGRFISYPSEAAHVAHALWVLHTHLMDQWESTPRLAFLSPEPGSGKSRALEVTGTLVPRPMQSINATAAALFRKVSDDAGPPTILYDEIDTVFGPKAKEHEDIRALINAGHRRGASAHRCVVRGKQIELEEFPAYCAVALAGLGQLPDTILTRSIIISMRRRAPSEQVEPWRFRLHEPQGERLRDRLAAWAKGILPVLSTDPPMPPEITDRDADVWEGLLSIADAVGGDWPKRSRVAAVTIVTCTKGGEGSLGVRLLTDLRGVFGDRGAWATTEIIDALINLNESPWADMRGKPLDGRRLARLLKPYEITPKLIRIGSDVFRGYERIDLQDAWLRYLPSIQESPLVSFPIVSVTSVTQVTSVASDVASSVETAPTQSTDGQSLQEVIDVD
jgi:phage/plasmid primase-like uncharacterized protein